MTKRTLWYVCLGLLCCLALAFAVQAAGQATKGMTAKSGNVKGVTPSNQAPDPSAVSQGSPTTVNPGQATMQAPPVDQAEANAKLRLSKLEAQLLDPRILTAAEEVPYPAYLKEQLNDEYAANPENQRPAGNPLDQGNDVCPGVVIPALPYTDTGTTVGYANNYTTCIGNTAPDVIYEYTPGTTGTRRVSLCGSVYDTAIEVRSVGACPGTTQNACNDDFCGLQSQVDVAMTAATTYFIIVDGYASSSGAYTLNVTDLATCDVVYVAGDINECAAEAPDSVSQSNDCNGGCNNTSGNFLHQDITCGQTVFGQVFTYLNPSGTNSRDTDWYLFTLSVTSDVTITLVGEVPMYGFIISGVCPTVTILAQATASTPCTPASATALALAPGTYKMWAGSQAYSGLVGQPDYRATLTCVPTTGRPCPTMTPADANLDPVPSTPWAGSVSGNAGNGGKWNASFTGTAGQMYHFDLCPDAPGAGTADYDIDIKICDAAGNILVYEDGSCVALAWRPNNFQWTCPTTGTYYVVLAPYYAGGHTCIGTAANTHTMQYYTEAAPPAPPNDNCANATVVPSFPATFTSDNTGATVDCPALGYREVWYTFTSTEACDLTISYCGTTPPFNNAFIVLDTVCPCSGAWTYYTSYTVCGDGNYEITWAGLAPGTYYAPVLAAVGAEGPYTVTFTCTPFVPCDVVPVGTPEGEACVTPDNYNGGCNSVPEIFQTIPCGTVMTGTSFFDGTTRDTDWYEIVSSVANDYTLTVTAEFDLQILIITAGPEPTPCVGYTYVFATGPDCQTVTLSTGPVPAGKYWFWVGPQFTNIFTCGEYNMTVTTASPCACGPVTDLTVLRGLGNANSVNLRWTGLAQGFYRVFGTTFKNNDGNPDNGADVQWTNLIDLPAPGVPGVMTYTDGPLMPYMNYAVVHDCAPRGRCCYGDPLDPTCLLNVTQATCTDVYQGTWTSGGVCPCPMLPSNDNCQNAEVIPSFPYVATGDNTTATVDCPALGAGPELWYTFTIGATCNLSIAYCGTSPALGNAYIVLDQSCPCSGVWVFATNWNNTACGDGNWTLNWNNIAPGTYYWPLLGGPGSQGPFTVTFTCGAPPPGPANDLCANAQQIFNGTPIAASNVSATTDGVWPCAAGGADVWYYYTATATGTVTASLCTGSAFDTALMVLASCGGTNLGCDDDACPYPYSRVLFAATAGTTYQIAVGGFASGTGSFTLSVTQ